MRTSVLKQLSPVIQIKIFSSGSWKNFTYFKQISKAVWRYIDFWQNGKKSLITRRLFPIYTSSNAEFLWLSHRIHMHYLKIGTRHLPCQLSCWFSYLRIQSSVHHSHIMRHSLIHKAILLLGLNHTWSLFTNHLHCSRDVNLTMWS